MPWVRFADDYLSNPKVLSLGPLPRLLDVSAIIYSARELRDGQLSRLDVQAVATLARIPRWGAMASELVKAGRWEATAAGYAIHDYLSYQPSREQVLAERERARQRKAHGRNPGEFRPDTPRNSSGQVPDSGGVPVAPYPYPVNPDPDPDPVPPRTPPDEQGGRPARRRRRRGAEPEFEVTLEAPEDDLACPEHAGHYAPKCERCLGAVRAYLDAKRQRNGVPV